MSFGNGDRRVIGRADDRPAVGSDFLAAEAGDADARTRLAVWTYEHLSWVVGEMVSRDRSAGACDFDSVLSVAMQRVEAGRHTVTDPDRFSGWVTVVGRNAYLNHIRGRPSRCVLRETDLAYDADSFMERHLDGEMLRRSLKDAISRLPAFLQSVARLRLLENRSYRSIALAVDKDVATVRSYVNKAVERLRRDERLLRVLQDLRAANGTGVR